jgi:exonuclease III
MPPRSAVKDTETIYSQNSRGLRTDKLEEVMATLMKLGLLAWCLQETWRLKLEQLDHHDTGCLSINHGLEEKVCRRGSLGVMIVLSPRAKAAYERGGCKKKTYGIRILSVLLVMEDEHEKMVKIRLVSAYAPTSNHPEDEHELYRGHLQQAVTEAKQNNEILIVGTDMNASCGRHDATMDDDTVQSPVGKQAKPPCSYASAHLA